MAGFTRLTRNAALLLADGTVFSGFGIGKTGIAAGEICFTTGMSGYQETLTDPSFSGQIITFTMPHIGNVGTNGEDNEGARIVASGLVIREQISEPSNFRSDTHLNIWLSERGVTGICGVDTRALTSHIRTHGAQNAVIGVGEDSESLLQEMRAVLETAPDMAGLELAGAVSVSASQKWEESLWRLAASNHATNTAIHTPKKNPHVVVIDYGQKTSIARNLVALGCRVTRVPATSSYEIIMALKPAGVLLSNGPGDPAATAQYAVPVIRQLIEANIPIFGICLGHQLLALALGARTEKMRQGHRGANHPIQKCDTGKVEITAQNHGFSVAHECLPEDVEVTHVSLFDGTIAGIRHRSKPVFSVQYHPESSPGPHDSRYLFEQFVEGLVA
jgi:carbamoyl-phosphate synthase small subunit